MTRDTATPAVTHGEIARRAFEFYCARDGQAGSAEEDWLRAERELRTGLDTTASRDGRRLGVAH